MSFLLRLFRSSKPPSDDYETVLANLATKIEKRKQQLADIRQRERHATAVVTLCTLAPWLVYLGVWYFGFVSGGKDSGVRQPERIARALPVFVGPIFILFIRRIVQLWYNRKGNQEEKSLQAAMKERRDKVEELKKKTNFYSTRDLLSRYDETSAPGTPQRPPQSAGPGPRKSVVPPPNGQQQSPLSISTASAPNPPGPPQPHRRTLFDAVADLLVGAEDQGPASQRYALICEKCFAHNGLVHETAWPDAQYKCPKCGHFNASARSRKVLERAAAGLMSPPPSAGLSVSSAVNQNGGAPGNVRKRVVVPSRDKGSSDDGEEQMEVDEKDSE